MPENSTFPRRSFIQAIGGASALSLGLGTVDARRSNATTSREIEDIVPVPVEATSTGAGYTITEEATIRISENAARDVAAYLAEFLRAPTG